MNFAYNLLGITLESDTALPFDGVDGVPACPQEEIAKLVVEDTPTALPNSRFFGHAEFDKNNVLINFGARGRLIASRGNTISVTPGAGKCVSDILRSYFPAAFAALCFQREHLMLHASCVEKNGNAIAFTGASGAGKSTAAKLMLEAGYNLLGDDVILPLSERGHTILYPGIPQLRLVHEVPVPGAAENELETAHSVKTLQSESRRLARKPAKLCNIVDLNWDISVGGYPHTEAVSGFEGFELLQKNQYRAEFLREMDLASTALGKIASLMQTVKIYRLYRSRDMNRGKEFVETVNWLVDN